jgi:hypothetical protein
MSADVDAHYFVTRFWGIGVNYSIFTSLVKMDYSVKDINSDIPVYYSANEQEKFYLNFIGPSFIFQQWIGSNHKFRLIEKLSLGYATFRSESQFDPYQYVFVNPNTNKKQYNILKEGNTFGGNFQLSFEYYPASWLSLSLNAGIYHTVFRSLKISDNNYSATKNFDKNDYLDLSRLDCSVGVNFHF